MKKESTVVSTSSIPTYRYSQLKSVSHAYSLKMSKKMELNIQRNRYHTITTRFGDNRFYR